MLFHRIRILSVAAFAAGISVLGPSARASITFLVSDLADASSAVGSSTVSPGTTDFAKFTLTSAGNLGTAALVSMKGSFTSPPLPHLSAEIVNDNAGAPGITILASSTGDSGTISSGAFNPITFNFTSQTLPAGTYWLGVSNSDATGSMLFQTEPTALTQAGNDGTVNSGFYTGATSSTNTGVFGISGTVAAVPEPASLALIGIPAAMALLRRRRQMV